MDTIACVYARDSRDDGADSFGIDSQTRYCLDYAQKHGMIVPPDYVLEEEWTGRDWDRPKFNTLRQLIEFRRVDAVLIYKVNRISRVDYHALMFLRDFCFRHKVPLHIIEWGRPIKDDSNDVILFGLQAQFGHIERDDIVRRTQRGRVEKAVQGIFLGQGTCVYGYEKTGSKKTTALAIVHEESAIVKLIFGMFVQKQTQITDIARYLNAQHIPSPSEKSNRVWQRSGWNHNSVLRILRDPRYTGNFYAFRYVKGEHGKSILRNKEEWIKQYFSDLAIIDQNLFNAAQDIIDSRKNRYTFAAKYNYLLNKRMACLCGHKAGVQTMNRNGKSYQYYRCAHKRSKPTECKLPYLDSVKLDIAMWDAIEYFIRNPAVVLEELHAVQQQQKQDYHDAIITVDTLDDIRKDYHARVNKLYDDYDRGIIPESVYLERKKPLDEGLQTAEKLYNEQQAVLEQHILSDRDIKHIVGECKQIADLLDEIGILEFEHKRRIVELFDITGEFQLHDNVISVRLSLHRKAFTEISGVFALDSQSFCSLMDVLATHNVIALKIIAGSLKNI